MLRPSLTKSAVVTATVAALAAVCAALVLLVPAATPVERNAGSAAEFEDASTTTNKRAIARALRREQRNGAQPKEITPSPEEAARCAQPNSELVFSTDAAALIYLDRGDDELSGPDRNRAAGCFYETGRITEFGFSATIEGDYLSSGASAGDFVGIVTYAWMADEASLERVELWNLRTGERRYRHECSTARSDCQISDFAVSTSGSIAYIACLDQGCYLAVKRPNASARRIYSRFPPPKARDLAVLVSADRLYWLNRKGQLRSIPFS